VLEGEASLMRSLPTIKWAGGRGIAKIDFLWKK